MARCCICPLACHVIKRVERVDESGRMLSHPLTHRRDTDGHRSGPLASSAWLDLVVCILRKATVKATTLETNGPHGRAYEKSLVAARTNKAAQPAVSERQKADEKQHERQPKPRTDVQRCPN
jgi:hypothetical protein